MSNVGPNVVEVTTEQLSSALENNVQLIDVREPWEYSEAHIPQAINIPLGELPERASEINNQGPIYVVCAAGMRSLAGADVLKNLGFEARSVAGGTNLWIQENRPSI